MIFSKINDIEGVGSDLSFVKDGEHGILIYSAIAVSCSIDIADDFRLVQSICRNSELGDEGWRYEIIGGATVNEGVDSVMEMCAVEEDCCVKRSFFGNEGGL